MQTEGNASDEVVRKKSAEKDEREVESQSSSVETLSVHDHMTRSSRSATPTPAISIEPDVGLNLSFTAAVLSFDENEIVTTDTTVAKARGFSEDSVIIHSDDESVDGDQIITDKLQEEGVVSEVGGADVQESEDTTSGKASPDHVSEGKAEATVSHSESDNVSSVVCVCCSYATRLVTKYI